MPISWHSPPKCLQVSPWPNSCMTFVHAQHHRQQEGVVDAEELVELGQLRAEHVELDRHQRQRRQAPTGRQSAHRHGREEPADVGVEPVQQPLGIEALEADAEDVADGAEEFLAAALVAAFAELAALAGHVGHHQPAAVQHAQELLQLLQRDLLRRELGLEPLLDLVQAGLAVEHLQDGVFLLLEAEVVQAHRVLHHPVAAAQVVLPPGGKVRPLADAELPGGTGQQAVGEGDHRQVLTSSAEWSSPRSSRAAAARSRFPCGSRPRRGPGIASRPRRSGWRRPRFRGSSPTCGSAARR